MKLRKFSILALIMTVLCMTLASMAAAAGSAVTLNAIPTVQPGGTVTITGTSALNEILIKVLRPGNSTLFYDIVKVTNGQFTDSFSIGSNETAGTYTVIVGQADQVASQTFIVQTSTTPPDPDPTLSSNADLSGLTLSGGTLNPAFDSGTTSYSVNVIYSVSSVTVTAAVADSKATVKVNGGTVANGHASGAINLNVGTNIINIEVKAENGNLKSYTVAVTRASDTTLPPTTPTYSGGGGSSPASSGKVTSTDGTLSLPLGKTGEVSLGDMIKIAIPADAFGQDLKLKIEKVVDTQGLITNKDVLVSAVFEILKNFTENFNKDVTLTFAFDPSNLKDNLKPSVFYYDEKNQSWVEVGGEVSGSTISANVNHFTKFAVFGVNKEAGTKQALSLSDISGHWAEANIKQAVGAGMVSGYPDGTFMPDRTVSRAEFAVMLMNALKPQGNGPELVFVDKAKIGAWAQKSVAQAVAAGIISGYEDNTFRPDAEITRPEMAVMIAKALHESGDTAVSTGFADDKNIPNWAKGAIAAIKKRGIIEGKGENQFAPDDKTTRAEAVTVLLKLQNVDSK